MGINVSINDSQGDSDKTVVESEEVETSVNGKSYRGKSARVSNNEIYVDGKKVHPCADGSEAARSQFHPVVIHANGDTKMINSNSGEIHVQGNVDMINNVSGQVNVTGDVRGELNSVSGNVKANRIFGNVRPSLATFQNFHDKMQKDNDFGHCSNILTNCNLISFDLCHFLDFCPLLTKCL